MKPKLILLNVALAAALGAIVWQAWNGWNQAQIARQRTLGAAVKPLPAPPLTPAPKPAAVPAVNFADVATKDLFSKDRNPDVVIEQPKVEPPKPMPPLPVVYGVLGLPSGTKAIMAEKSGEPGRAVHEGDKVGAFTIASLDPKTVVFDWDGKKVSKNVDDLIDRSSATNAGPAVVSVVSPAAASTPRPETPSISNVRPGPGKEIGPGYRACVAGDNSPGGTVVDGYKKNAVSTPFGVSCNWTQVQ